MDLCTVHLKETDLLLEKATAARADGCQAERLGAVALLARILHRLQQNLSNDEAGIAPQCKWYSVMKGLAYIIVYIVDPTTQPKAQHVYPRLSPLVELMTTHLGYSN